MSWGNRGIGIFPRYTRYEPGEARKEGGEKRLKRRTKVRDIGGRRDEPIIRNALGENPSIKKIPRVAHREEKPTPGLPEEGGRKMKKGIRVRAKKTDWGASDAWSSNIFTEDLLESKNTLLDGLQRKWEGQGRSHCGFQSIFSLGVIWTLGRHRFLGALKGGKGRKWPGAGATTM